MITKINTGHELYVYMNGRLLYKRWFNYGYGKVFCDVWGNRPFSASDSMKSITDEPTATNQTSAGDRTPPV